MSLFYDEDSGNVTFCCNEMVIVRVNLHNIDLDNNFEEDGIVVIKLLAWHNNLKNAKHLKKELNEELMPIAWLSKRWWKFHVSEDEKKEIEPNFTAGL